MTSQKRIWEIDFIRGIAIMLMVAFHTVVVLKDFHSFNLSYQSGFWYFEGKLSAILFILTAGISSTFSRNNIKRGVIVLGFGMLLTLVTYLYNPEFFIRFGILHFLGISMILYHFIYKIDTRVILLFSVFTVIIGNILLKSEINSPLLFPIGLTSPTFTSLDYYPVVPWFGVFLWGAALGRKLYKDKLSLIEYPPKFNVLSLLGRHSLLVYLVHVPMIIGVLWVLSS